jgi:hypothetical protein
MRLATRSSNEQLFATCDPPVSVGAQRANCVRSGKGNQLKEMRESVSHADRQPPEFRRAALRRISSIATNGGIGYALAGAV